ncbi:hypothetical protein UA08_03749 [Talaromyces atroroseus]|uniref:NACHT domain-containing protein n=1 Tax=Talaromyces atroroseus TaxID=1441469 RepID=A0A225AIX3_TALAT|nr:hypothetical protein UA08_03749 [Talaromyces atroroseus]OKL60830.1 hypothetical protein UA08_03749 [Talaromyces atroroseus]
MAYHSHPTVIQMSTNERAQADSAEDRLSSNNNVFSAPGGLQSNNPGSGNQFVSSGFYGPVSFGAVESHMRERQNAVLKSLAKLKYQDQKNRNPDRTRGTCEWFTKHATFKAWQEARVSQMLWVSAGPGCGKSVLAKYLADHPGKKSSNEFESSDIITSSFSELWGVLISVAKENKSAHIICILDGFDECEQLEQSQFTEALRGFFESESRKQCNLKFLVTSRLYGTIRRAFQPLEMPGQPMIHLSGENNAVANEIAKEIDIFIETKVEELRNILWLSEDERDFLLAKLTSVPNRTYIWVSLTLSLIQNMIKVDRRTLLNATTNLPQTVNEAYERILARATDQAEASKLLHIIVGAMRPLTVQEMSFALALEKEHRSYADLNLPPNNRFEEYLRDLCGLFVTIVNSEVYLIHQTAREFLVDENVPREIDSQLQEDSRTPQRTAGSQINKWEHSLNVEYSHTILANICIWHLLFTDFKKPEIKSLDTSMMPRPIETRLSFQSRRSVSPRKYPSKTNSIFFNYSALYWSNHLLGSNIEIYARTEELLAVCGNRPVWFDVYWENMITSDDPPSFDSIFIGSYFGITPVVDYWMEFEDIDINAKDNVHGRSALSWAAGNGHENVVKLLTQTSRKSIKKGHYPVMRMLIEKDIDVETNDSQYGRTPLLWATVNNHIAMVRLLLEKGANTEAKDNQYGRTPLLWAVHDGHEAIVKLLLEKGADTEVKDSQYNQTPVSMAALNGHEAIVEILLKKGANTHAEDSIYGRTLLSWAAMSGRYAVAKLLLERGADIEAKDSQDNRTPLLWAVMNNRTELVELLLENGADIEAKEDPYERTSLIWAAEKCPVPMIKLLLEKGADVEAKDINGENPLTLAIRRSRGKDVELLIKHVDEIKTNKSDR